MNIFARYAYIVLDIILLIIIYILKSEPTISLMTTAFFVNIISLYIIFTVLLRTKSQGSFSGIFCIIYYLFLFGRVTLQYGFNYTTNNYSDVFGRFSDESVYQAILFALIFFIGIHIGIMSKEVRADSLQLKMKHGSNYINKSIDSNRALIKTGDAIFIVSIIPLIVNYFWKFAIELNVLSNPTGLIEYVYTLTDIFADMFFFWIIIQISVKKRKVILPISVAFYASMMAWGARGQPALIIILILIVYAKSIKPIKLNFIRVVISYMLLSITSSIFLTIQLLRVHGTSYIISNFTETFIKNFTTTNPILEIVYEIGIALSPLMQIMEIVPQKVNYQWGSTIVYSALAGIPGLSKLVPSSVQWQANIPAWLSQTTGTTYGGTMAVDFYINFGFFSVVIAIFIGILINIISEITHNYLKKESITSGRYVFSVVLLLPIIWWPRSSLLYFFGYIGRTFFLPLLLYGIFLENVKRQNRFIKNIKKG